MSTPAVADPPPLTGHRLVLSAFAISLAFFLVILDLTVVNVSLSHIAGNLGASTTQSTWVITAYAVSEAIFLPLSGWLARRFGTLRTFQVGLVGFMISSILCGLATSLPQLVAARVLQGMCGAPILPLQQTLLLRIFPRDRAGTAMGLGAFTAIVGPILGPVIGGAITDELSWRLVFFLNVPFVLICIPLTSRLLRGFETPTKRERIDYVGLILVIIWVGALQLMFDLGREHDWFDSGLIVALAIIAAVGFCAFLIWELTEETPIIDLRVLRHRGFWTAAVCCAVAYSTFMVTVVLVPLWVQTVMGYTAVQAGFVMAPLSILSLVAIPIAARQARSNDARWSIFLAICWLGVVALFRSQITSTSMTTASIALPQLLQGMATALFMIGLMVIGMTSVDPHETATASGIMVFIRTIAVGATVSGATTLWDTTTREARMELTGVLNGGEQALRTMMSGGLSEMQARAMLDRMVEIQSMTIAYNHVFLLAGAACMFAALLVWIVPHPAKMRAAKGAAAAGAGH